MRGGLASRVCRAGREGCWGLVARGSAAAAEGDALVHCKLPNAALAGLDTATTATGRRSFCLSSQLRPTARRATLLTADGCCSSGRAVACATCCAPIHHPLQPSQHCLPPGVRARTAADDGRGDDVDNHSLRRGCSCLHDHLRHQPGRDGHLPGAAGGCSGCSGSPAQGLLAPGCCARPAHVHGAPPASRPSSCIVAHSERACGAPASSSQL